MLSPWSQCWQPEVSRPASNKEVKLWDVATGQEVLTLKGMGPVAFTLDGPRGPRYKVKPGPVALGRSSGVPLAMFHMAVDKVWVLNTWDRLMIPLPLSRVLVRVGKMIHVPPDASDEDIDRYTAELQAALDRVREFAEANVSKVGTPEFPYYKRSG